MNNQERLNFMKTHYKTNADKQKPLNLQHKELYINENSSKVSLLEETITKLEKELHNTQNALLKNKEESRKKDIKITSVTAKATSMENQYIESQKQLNKLEQISTKGNVDIKSMKILFDREMQNIAQKLKSSEEEVAKLNIDKSYLKVQLEEETAKNSQLNEQVTNYKNNQKDIIKYQKENSMYKNALRKQIQIDTTNNSSLIKEFTSQINRQVEENIEKQKKEEIQQLKKDSDKIAKQLQESLQKAEVKLATSTYETNLLKKNYDTERHKTANITNQLETLRKKYEKQSNELET